MASGIGSTPSGDATRACSLVLIFVLARASFTYVRASNTTDASQSNSFNTTTPPAPGTTMSFTFIARPNATAAAAPGVAPVQRYNASVVERLYQDYEEQYMQHNHLVDLSEEEQCVLRKKVEDYYLDYDAAENGRYCGTYFDTILCWPASPPGVVYRSCPEELNEIFYDTSYNVTRYCDFDGSWGNGNKSNYSSCTAVHIPNVTAADTALQVLVYAGYSLSLTALVGAFCIFLFFRSLRCVRNYIHWNLVSSFVLLYITYFIASSTAGAVQQKPELHWICRLMLTVMMYTMMTNFFWMFVEGVYLYTLVVRALTVHRSRFWIYCIFGWGVPLPFVLTYAIIKKITGTGCWVPPEANIDKYAYIVIAPIFVVIVVNLYFLIHIMAILVTKLRASHSLETQQYRKGVKGTLFLLPLLGVTYLLFLLGPVNVPNGSKSVSFYVYQYIATTLSSLQGFFVAVIYVFLNQEVQNVIKRKIRRWREESTLPTRVVSRRGSNTRSSFGNLGLFSGRRGGNTGGGNSEQVTAFKLPGGNVSPDVYSNGSKVPPFIRLDEVQPLTPGSEAPTSPQTLYSSVSSGNGNDAEAQLTNGDRPEDQETSSCNDLSESPETDCNELPLLAVKACGASQPLNGTTDSSSHGPLESAPPSGSSSIPQEDLLLGNLENNGIPNGNHNNNNNSLSPCPAKPKATVSPFAGRSRVTFADELVHESHKRPACCDVSKNSEAHNRSPARKPDSERLFSRGQLDGDDSPETGPGKHDTQRSPLLPCIRKKPWAAPKPNGTIAFPKAPEGTPV